MTTEMKAVVYHAPGDIRIESIPVPECGNDELRVKVDACAVCGTDLKAYLAGNPRIKAPKVMGHEFTGLIETVGPEVTIGRLVAGFPADSRNPSHRTGSVASSPAFSSFTKSLGFLQPATMWTRLPFGDQMPMAGRP